MAVLAFGLAAALGYAQSPPPAMPASVQDIATQQRREAGEREDARLRERLREVMASPDFSTERTMRVPAYKGGKSTETPAWMEQVERFIRFIADVLRAGVWVFAAIGAAILLVTAHRWWRMRARRPRADAVNVPTHVGSLDIRAESLPEDVGAAARLRWTKGDVAGCLSLLYRGALSALVLRHEAAIRTSSTEAECLRAARARLAEPAYAYFDALTQCWLQAVYAGRRPDDAAVLASCDAFAAHFQPTAVSAAPVSTAGAAA